MRSERNVETPEDVYADFLARREAGEELGLERLVAERPEMDLELRRLHAEQAALAEAFGELPPLGASSTFFRDRGRAIELEGFTVAGVPLRRGVEIGGYELVRPLGQGGMGQVWEAWQRSVDRAVALKFIRADHVTPTAVERFRTEARAGGRVNHPGIVGVLDAGCQEGRHWIAQELVEGGCTLRDVIADVRAGEIPRDWDRRVAELFCEIADALQTAHDAGVVHRDVKPQNVLVTRDDHPKIGDFGLARLLGEETLTRTGLQGTPCYMSPEQATEKPRGLDARTDVFSLGTVLYEMLTLTRPFDGETSVQVLARILHHDPPDPRVLRPEVPKDLAVITMGALEKRREDRYQSMGDLAGDLRRWLRREPILRQPPTARERALKWVRRHPTWTAIGALVLLLVAAVAGLGGEAAEQRGRADVAERELGYVSGRWAFDRGELDEGVRAIEAALALDPTDARGYVYLAFGYLEFARLGEAERAVARAQDLGFGTAPPPAGADAEDHLAYGLFRLVRDKSAGFGAAEKHLARALELDPLLEGAMRPLYEVRRFRGDTDGAREALEQYRSRIPDGDDLYPVVEALLAELDGDHEGAIARLASIGHLPQDRLLGLRWYRELARNQLRAGHLDDAEVSLRVQVEHRPDDGPAWELLTQLELRRYEAGRDGGAPRAELRDHLDRAAEAAAHSSEWDPVRPGPYWDRAVIAVARLEAREDPSSPIPDDIVRDARERLRELEDVAPDHSAIPRLASQVSFYLALERLGAGDVDGAVGLFEEAIAIDPDHLVARLRLAQRYWFAGDFEACLDQTEAVIERWSDDAWSPRWLFVAHVWALGAASALDDVDRAREAIAGAESNLPENLPIVANDVLSYAEFLGTAESEDLRDCERARELVSDYDLRRTYAGRASGEGILRLIDAACP